MNKDQFVVREKALEEEFFARENAKLKESLQRKLHDEEASAALAKASGITDETVLQHMLAAGLTPQTGAAFALLPLILTAWADGKLDDAERSAVLAAAMALDGAWHARRGAGPHGARSRYAVSAGPPPARPACRALIWKYVCPDRVSRPRLPRRVPHGQSHCR